MTTTHAPIDASPTWPMFAAVSTGVSLVLTAIGTFWSPLASYDATRTGHDLMTWLVVAAITVVAAVVVFGLVVRPAPAAVDRRTIVLAILGAVSIVVFWTGLPLVFTGGSVALALSRPVRPATRFLSLGVGVAVTGVAIWAALAG